MTKIINEVKDDGAIIQKYLKKLSIDIDKYVKTKMGKDNIHYRNINKALKEVKDQLSTVVGLDLSENIGKRFSEIIEAQDKNEKGDKEEYKKFFDKTLKAFGVDNPSKLSPEKKKEFFDKIDAGWKADNETDKD